MLRGRNFIESGHELRRESIQKECAVIHDRTETEYKADNVQKASLSSSHQLNDPSSYIHGVMPHQDRLPQFEATLKEVICPGFVHFGIDAKPMQHWVKEKLYTKF